MRIGIVGGTLDPIHIGHLVVAVNVHRGLGLDETRVIPAGDPWMRDRGPFAPGAERFEMAQAAVDDLGVPGIVADDCEVRRDGPTYTIDTVEEILRNSPDSEVFLAIGADAAKQLPEWHRVDELRGLVTLVVVNRGDNPTPDMPGWKREVVSIPSLEVSSSLLRERLASGLPVEGLVPAAAMRVLRKYGRYAGSR